MLSWYCLISINPKAENAKASETYRFARFVIVHPPDDTFDREVTNTDI